MSEQDVIDAVLEDHLRRYIEGDGRQLIMAVIFCGRRGIAPPSWVTEAFQTIART
jgi:hypothetical protein